MIVAYVNYAASLTPAQLGEADTRRAADCALRKAKKQAKFLLRFWSQDEHQNKFPALYQSMYAAVNFAAEAIGVERYCSLHERFSINGVLNDSELQSPANMTLLARSEHACVLTSARRRRAPDTPPETGQAIA